jgi:hypothetical protein
MEPFVARPSRARLTLMLIACLLFVAVSLWMIGAFGEAPRLSGRRANLNWVGWIGAPFFGIFAVVALAKLRDCRDRLVIDGRGILWRAWSDEVIPWTEIERIEERQIARQTMFSVYLHDPARCPPKGWTGRIAASQRGFGAGDMAITLSGTDKSDDELREALSRFCPVPAEAP